MPWLTTRVVVLPAVKLPGPPATDSVTRSLLSNVWTLPKASSTCTCTGGLIAAPAIELLGCTLKAKLFAAPGTTVKLLELVPLI